MAKVTLKRINVFSVAKWHGVSALLSGFLVGTIYFGVAFYFSGQRSFNYWFYYLVVVPLIYVIVTVFVSTIGGGIYNSLSESFGGMRFEIETDDAEINLPPSPPETWS